MKPYRPSQPPGTLPNAESASAAPTGDQASANSAEPTRVSRSTHSRLQPLARANVRRQQSHPTAGSDVLTQAMARLEHVDLSGRIAGVERTAETYHAEWQAWATSPTAAADEKRDEAVIVMKQFLADPKSKKFELDFFHMNLQELPQNLPPGFTRLDLEGNRLKATPENLPQNLDALLLNDNPIGTVPSELPALLKELQVGNCGLSGLPELPRFLEILFLDCNHFSALPELPKSLSDLSISGNDISELPAFPERLKLFSAHNTQIKSFPKLPDSLLEFKCNETPIDVLPALPASMKRLRVDADVVSRTKAHLAAVKSRAQSVLDTIAPLIDTGSASVATAPSASTTMIQEEFAVIHDDLAELASQLQIKIFQADLQVEIIDRGLKAFA